ncbi:sensor histidine kinase, partial [Luedemannella flava]|uniref:sensor histidine kinase n=1 Tax=Luedemannella flava TaxID=349316 RepID=UPI0031D1A3EC
MHGEEDSARLHGRHARADEAEVDLWRAAAAAVPAPALTGGRFRTIRAQLVRMAVVPLLCLLVAFGVGIAAELDTYRTAEDVTHSVAVALTVQDLIHELQRERGLTNGLLGGQASYTVDVAQQRKRVDAARGALDRLIAAGGVTAGARTALGQLDGLVAVRAGVNARTAARAATFTFYTDSINALADLDLGVDRASDVTLRRGFAALQALGAAKEAAAKERGFLNGVFAAGKFTLDEYTQFSSIRADKLSALATFVRYATPAQRSRNDAALSSPAASEATKYEQTAIRGARGDRLGVSPPAWWAAMTTVIDAQREVQRAVGADIQANAEALRDDARTALFILIGLAAACMAGAILLVLASARAITRPLAALAAEADDIASRRLPDAVDQVQTTPDAGHQPLAGVRLPDKASVEIRSVAHAFDRVQATAYALAGNQAILRRNTTESLANLGRRNQNLLRRQIGFISRLEREEGDPSALANLFELDHLATRMRRNAESLLVLVGESTPRRWKSPKPVTDVIRAALSEVEDYRRVSLRRLDDALIGGGYVTDVAHMIAELVENGLAFSPPDVDVEIHGRRLGGQYLIAIIDHGAGMSDEALAQANARLSGSEHFLVAPTRHLGHYVVGRLAERLGAHVQISQSPVTGVTARIMLPATVLAAPGELEEPAAPALGTAGPPGAPAPALGPG